MGIRHSVKSCILQKNPGCLTTGCNCHLAHLAVSKGGAAYHKKTGFHIEQHQADLYQVDYFFNKSTHRKDVLAEYMEFVVVRNGRK